MVKALQSKAFPNAYLRIDGSSVSSPSNSGGGTVNCQSGWPISKPSKKSLSPTGR